ncbi:MAG: helix-hairpin-helix domain-containing protein, partial [Actinomycetota bacterium]|nr:helix-hairpin-helix domain-containing protein [Actinomycetota bacterium]
VMAAGGALGVADLGDLNLAASVSDGQQVVVPVRGSTQVEEGVGQGETKGEDGPIQLNEASAAELETLPGVGPVLAERIVAQREEHGPFASVEDLLDVPGIGEAKLAALRDLVVLP